MHELKSILIVDDQMYNVEIVIDTLQTSIFEFNIYRANNAKLALEIAKKKIPDVIVTDWDMPEMSGIELIEELKKEETTKNIPVIIFSGIMITSKNLQTALKAGAFDYVRKPIDKIELESRIFSALRHSEILSTLKNERKQLLSILDSIPELIYVSDIETNKILFSNKQLKETIGEDITGKNCYQAIQGKNGTCEFCTNKFIKNSDEPYFWEHYNPILDKHYYIMDRKIKWTNQQDVRFELAIDITQRKKAEQENKKLSVAVEQNPASIVITDLRGKIEYINPAFTKQTGYSKEEAIGINPRILKSGRTNPEVYTQLWKTITAGKIWEGEFINKTKNEEEYIEKATIAPIFNKENKKTHYIAIKENITEKAKIEKQIKESEEKYRLITENASDVIWILNLSKEKYTYISPSVFALRGYSVEEAMAQDVSQSLTPESTKLVTDSIAEIIPQFLANPVEESKKIHRHELRQPCKDGSVIWIETSTRYQFNANNEIEVIGISRNIEERKKHQEYLSRRLRYEENLAMFSTTLFLNEPNVINKSLQFLLEAAECSRVYIFENFIDENNKLSMKQTFEVCAENVNPEIDNPDLKHIIYGEDGFETWEKQLSGNKSISGIVPDFPEAIRAILEAENIKSILILPIFVYQKWFGFVGFDDTLNFRKWNTEDVDLLRTAAYILGLFIENQKNKKTIETRNTELKEAIATKDKFFNIIAHDLKNPFNSILGFSDLLIDNIEKYDKEKIKRFVKSINESGKNTFKLLENLLAWSRIQQNKIPFNPEKNNLYFLAFEAYMLINHTAKEKKITINLDVSKEINFKADSEMIKTVIRNLVSNAIKYTPENGKINILGKQINNNTIIKISDTGIGMDEQTKNSLFKIGETKSKEGTNGERGTGFGLLLCKEFVDKHKGTIKIESELNKGSNFIITIPLNT
ncbi:MAG: PAS domain S-box protein [Bacteroidales bacterium]|nr:PAS domain S-box protein [Bacteroidales bacterium]